MEKPKRLKIVQRKAHNPSNGQTNNSYTSAHRTLPVGFGKDPKTAEKRHSTAAFRRPQRKPTLALVVLGFVLLVQACRKVQGRFQHSHQVLRVQALTNILRLSDTPQIPDAEYKDEQDGPQDGSTGGNKYGQLKRREILTVMVVTFGVCRSAILTLPWASNFCDVPVLRCLPAVKLTLTDVHPPAASHV